MDFYTAPICNFWYHQIYSKQNFNINKAEIFELLNMVIINLTDREDDKYVSSIFTRKLKDGIYKTILNLKIFETFSVCALLLARI